MSTNTSDIFIDRQPIFNRDQQAVAYKLLFRPNNSDSAEPLDSNIATAQVIQNCLLEISLDNLVDTKVAFINFPTELLTSELGHVLPAERVVLEILENVDPNQESLDGVTELVNRGFKIALDDFEYNPKWDPFLKLASVVKLDVFGKKPGDVEKSYNLIKEFNVELLAEKSKPQKNMKPITVWDSIIFKAIFSQSPMSSKKKLPDNQMAILQITSKPQNPAVSVAEAKQLLSQTVALNYKLFRYINSAYFNLPRQFESVREAVAYIGLKKLKNLASLLTLIEINVKPSELIIAGLTRAKMCEIIATTANLKDPERYFMKGLFSILEPLIGRPMKLILENLPLGTNVVDALLNVKGVLSEALLCSLAYEQCT